MSTVFGLIVGVLDGAALAIIGVPLPVLWACSPSSPTTSPTSASSSGWCLRRCCAADLGLPEMLLVIAVYCVLNFVIQSLIQPRYVGDSVGLAMTTTFVALVFWAWLLGPLGALLAIPLTLLAKALLVDVDPTARWATALAGSLAAGDLALRAAAAAGPPGRKHPWLPQPSRSRRPDSSGAEEVPALGTANPGGTAVPTPERASGHDDDRPGSGHPPGVLPRSGRTGRVASWCPPCSSRRAGSGAGCSWSAGATAAAGSCRAVRSTSVRMPSSGRGPRDRRGDRGAGARHRARRALQRPRPRRPSPEGEVRQQFAVLFRARALGGTPPATCRRRARRRGCRPGPRGAPDGAGRPALDRAGPVHRGAAVPRVTLLRRTAGGASSTIGTMAITATRPPPSMRSVPSTAVTARSHTAA